MELSKVVVAFRRNEEKKEVVPACPLTCDEAAAPFKVAALSLGESELPARCCKLFEEALSLSDEFESSNVISPMRMNSS